VSVLDLFKLDGKVALVTGAGQGIGRAYALALAEAGADVAVADINVTTGRRVADEIAALGRRAAFVKTDVMQAEEIERMVAATLAELGGLDIAVNNAWAGGRFATPAPAEEFPLEEWDFILNLALRAIFVGCQAEARVMRKKGRGKIVNMASMSAGIANAAVAYCSAKAGVVMLTRRLAAEWGKYNINVNCISPSYTLSPARRRDPQENRDLIRSLHPMGWHERPEDLCGTLVYLASDASNYVTGRDILVDGGHTLNVWLQPLTRAVPPLVSPEDEIRSLVHDLEVLGIPHDDRGVTLE
jgi:NAD(P)-dependent dehydrogenase (short-subunit alcohol dehydrogenase family)